MVRRAPMTRELADLIGRSVLASLEYAESYPKPSGRPSGTFAQDLTAIDAVSPESACEVRGKLHATVVEIISMLLAHATDHIRALAHDMQRDPVPVWSPLTLCRSVLESTVWMCHLLDPEISTDTRLCRIAALWLDDTQPARTAAATFGSEHAAGVDEHHSYKLNELEAGGFTIDVDRRQRPVRVRLGPAAAPLKLNMTEEITRLMPENAPSPYRLSSGAAHGRPWMLERSVSRTEDGQLVGEGSTSEAAALAVMLCMEAWLTAWGSYFGLDVTHQVNGIYAVARELGRQSQAMG
jgi:hypothetical protein